MRKLIMFLADHVFRFSYRDPCAVSEDGTIILELDVWEEENDKMLYDFFYMGLVTGTVLTIIVAGILWLMI